MRSFAANLALLCGTLLVTALLLEFVVFRYVLPASDIPRNDFANGVVKYLPHQSGTYRVRKEIEAPYRINANGWNSGHSRYPVETREDVQRIAIIGDSYIEAFQVPVDRSAGEILEATLGKENHEVFRFGISGAPLSQYLHMLEREVLGYDPQVVIIVLVHNDFDESYRFKAGRYTSSFLKLEIKDDEVTKEIPPEPYQETWVDLLRMTATVRYLYYRWGVTPETIKRGIARLMSQSDAQGSEQEQFQANINVSDVLSEQDKTRLVVGHIFNRLRELSRLHDTKLLIVMDGDRQGIYRDSDKVNKSHDTGVLVLNRMVQQAAERRGIPFLDLQAVFSRDFEATRHRFDFDGDNHWNEHGHQVVARALAEALRAMSSTNK